MKVDIIKLSDIEFGERGRGDYGDIDELAHSIKTKGMITPMAVQSTPGCSKPYILIAGGRRYKAASLIKLDEVPVRIYEHELSNLDFKEIELFENVHRKDLEWTERVRMERDIHTLQVEKFGEKISKSADAPGHTLSDTGKMIGKTGEHVRQSIILANALEVYPQLFNNCKSKSDATKIVKMISEEAIKSEIVNRIKNDNVGKSSKLNLADNFILESFFQGVSKIPKGSINLVEIDPPYAIELQKAKKVDSGQIRYGESYNEIDEETYPSFMKQTLKLCYEVMAEHSWLIVWFAPEPWFEYVYNWIIEAGFECKRMCGIWKKPSGQNKRPETQLANSYEMFFYACKGKPALAKARGNVFDFPTVPPQKKTHPTERPVEMMQEIYSTFTFPGSKILIPFVGSGSGIIAADSLGMTAVGFELGKEFKDSFLIKIYNM